MQEHSISLYRFPIKPHSQPQNHQHSNENQPHNNFRLDVVRGVCPNTNDQNKEHSRTDINDVLVDLFREELD